MGYKRKKIKSYCDEPMARSKHYIRKSSKECKNDCGSCIACIQIDEAGYRAHVREGAGLAKLTEPNQPKFRYHM